MKYARQFFMGKKKGEELGYSTDILRKTAKTKSDRIKSDVDQFKVDPSVFESALKSQDAASLEMVCHSCELSLRLGASVFPNSKLPGYDRDCEVHLEIENNTATLRIECYRLPMGGGATPMDIDIMRPSPAAPMTVTQIEKDKSERAWHLSARWFVFPIFFDAASKLKMSTNAYEIHYEGASPRMRFEAVMRGIRTWRETPGDAVKMTWISRELDRIVGKEASELTEKDLKETRFQPGSIAYCHADGLASGYVLQHSRWCSELSSGETNGLPKCNMLTKGQYSDIDPFRFALVYADKRALESQNKSLVESITVRRDALSAAIKSVMNTFELDSTLVKIFKDEERVLSEYLLKTADDRWQEIKPVTIIDRHSPLNEKEKLQDVVLGLKNGPDKIDWKRAKELFGTPKQSLAFALVMSSIKGCQVLIDNLILVSPIGTGSIRGVPIGHISGKTLLKFEKCYTGKGPFPETLSAPPTPPRTREKQKETTAQKQESLLPPTKQLTVTPAEPIKKKEEEEKKKKKEKEKPSAVIVETTTTESTSPPPPAPPPPPVMVIKATNRPPVLAGKKPTEPPKPSLMQELAKRIPQRRKETKEDGDEDEDEW